MSNILVPTDGSDTAQQASRYAIDLAKQLKCSVIILSVIDNRSLLAQTIPAQNNTRQIAESVDDYLKDAAEAYAREIEAICDEHEVKSKIVIKTGHPAEEIIKEAEKSKSVMIVIGSHGRSAWEAAILGSVTYSIIHKESKIPVLIVRR